MNKTRTKTLGMLALCALGLTAIAAHADIDRNPDGPLPGNLACPHDQAYLHQFHVRQHRQMARIRAGMRDGRLNRTESSDLLHEQRMIDAMARRFRADGCIDGREFHRLQQAQDLAGQHLRAEKHDRPAR